MDTQLINPNCIIIIYSSCFQENFTEIMDINVDNRFETKKFNDNKYEDKKSIKFNM